jgi:hypothetical protein
MEERIIQLEAEADRLRQDVEALRQQFVQAQLAERLLKENERLNEAILRYAIACGAVDVQMAMMRARNENRDDVMANLKIATDEEEAASKVLRELAQEYQKERRRNLPNSGGIGSGISGG